MFNMIKATCVTSYKNFFSFASDQNTFFRHAFFISALLTGRVIYPYLKKLCFSRKEKLYTDVPLVDSTQSYARYGINTLSDCTSIVCRDSKRQIADYHLDAFSIEKYHIANDSYLDEHFEKAKNWWEELYGPYEYVKTNIDLAPLVDLLDKVKIFKDAHKNNSESVLIHNFMKKWLDKFKYSTASQAIDSIKKHNSEIISLIIKVHPDKNSQKQENKADYIEFLTMWKDHSKRWISCLTFTNGLCSNKTINYHKVIDLYYRHLGIINTTNKLWLVQLDQTLAKKDMIIAKYVKSNAQKDIAISKKDAEISKYLESNAQKNAEISKLKEQIAKLSLFRVNSDNNQDNIASYSLGI